MPEQDSLTLLHGFFARPVCVQALAPLSIGSKIVLHVEQASFTLLKEKTQAVVQPGAADKPDLSFTLPLKALVALSEETADSVGDMGIALLKRMVASEDEGKLTAKVHIGLFDLYRRGYFSVLTLGGPQVMSFLAGKGLNGMGKIKDAIGKIRESK